ncbi:hypothetical protein StoSoilB20_09230 [Arthrobacter sp. StoSoilB20]|nr:hypothetical protein StoSoilB20_09230 [Arthrobacter sp. StoSoilB20]
MADRRVTTLNGNGGKESQDHNADDSSQVTAHAAHPTVSHEPHKVIPLIGRERAIAAASRPVSYYALL